jgi:hypothetical protein
MIRDVHVEQMPDRLKVVLPVKRQPFWLLLFSLLLIVWLAGLIWGIVFTIRDIAFSGERFAIVFTIMMLIWLYIWYRLGRILWQQWQYFAATREILFFEKERLMIRRPVSMMGTTDAYDMGYVSPFFYSDEENSPGFTYGSRRVYFGRGLDELSAQNLVRAINERYFDVADEDEY